MEEFCIVCGAPIPEGRQVCHRCEAGSDAYDPLVGRTDSVYCRDDNRRDVDCSCERE